jgi:hypothetical protein
VTSLKTLRQALWRTLENITLGRAALTWLAKSSRAGLIATLYHLSAQGAEEHCGFPGRPNTDEDHLWSLTSSPQSGL